MLDYELQNTKWAQLALHTGSEVLAVHGFSSAARRRPAANNRQDPPGCCGRGMVALGTVTGCGMSEIP